MVVSAEGVRVSIESYEGERGRRGKGERLVVKDILTVRNGGKGLGNVVLGGDSSGLPGGSGEPLEDDGLCKRQ
jgi:hypothetical protein